MLRYARLSLRKLVIYVVVVAHYLLIYSLWMDTAHHRCPVEVTSDHRQRRSDVRSVLSGEENALNSASNSSAEVHSHFQKEAPKSGQARNGKESLKNVVKDHSVLKNVVKDDSVLKKQGTKESNSIHSNSSQTLVSVKTKTAEKGQNGVKMTPKRTAEKGNQSLPKDTHGKLLVTANNTITPRPLNCSGCFRSEFPTLLDQPELCRVYDNQSIDVVFLIATAGTHTAERHAIRNTWATATKNNTSNIRHLFVLGTTTDAKRMRAIEEEGRHFRDVVVSGFHDSYLNLTLKTVASLRWLTSRCAHARFFVKVDDDVWVNSRAVQHVLTNHTDFLQRGLGGHCASANKPKRYKSKWFVPMEVYPDETYPPYCYGFGYAGSVTLAQHVVAVASDVPSFFLEDVYLGMCLKRLGFGVRTFDRFRNFRNKNSCKEAKSRKNSMILNITPKTMFQYWDGC